MTPEERDKAKQEAKVKGKEEEKFEGLGAFEQDGTASEKQVEYIKSLLQEDDQLMISALSHKPTDDDMAEVKATGLTGRELMRAQGDMQSIWRKQDELVETLGMIKLDKPGPYVRATDRWDYDTRGFAAKRRQIAYKVAQRAVDWGKKVDASKLSKRGASAFIEQAKGPGGVFNAFLGAFGGNTVQGRAAFISSATGFNVTADDEGYLQIG